MITVFIRNLREIEEQIKEIENLPFVKGVVGFVPTSLYYFENWIDKLIQKNAQD